MKKSIILLLCIWMMMPAMCSKAAEMTTDATWIWNPWSLRTEETKILNFLVKNNVDQVYLQVDSDLSNSVYQQFIAKATAKNIEIYALDGAPDWATQKGKTKQTAFFQWVKAYQSKSSANQQFQGIHLDVEPYILSNWDADRSSTVLYYQEIIRNSANQSAKLNLPFTIDMPFWFDSINFQNKFGKSNLAKWAINLTDGVTVMAYRNMAAGENGINTLVKTEWQYAQNANKPITIAVETGQSDEGIHISFYQKSSAYMKAELAKVNKAYPENNVKFAVHYIDSWMKMK
ncbi:amidase [Niallia nealsonii]|uniref:Amidase n=1 Tax=Niallia nealsonii TaxID=115979 RepID=A0A2N0Z2P1_9BACI|nr:amidase [Niallia nealsonii]PKG23770.1 amidase [Niallia nealsonii]